MTPQAIKITAALVAQQDREAAQARYERAVARKDTQAQRRAMERLREATLRAIRAEAAL